MDDGGNSNERNFVDRPGPSRLVREVVNGDDEFANTKLRRTSYNSHRNEQSQEVHVAGSTEEDEIQIIQDSSAIVQRDANGEMFVLMDEVEGNDMSVEYVEDDALDPIHYSTIRSNIEAVFPRRPYAEFPQGLKARKNRQYGNCKCPECGASFVNTARLERHLSVHQVFGSFLCPLCAKTYKYEYNLFYHWRKTCKDLDDLIPAPQRNVMDVSTLRQLVDEVVKKKADFGPVDIGISRSVLFQSGPLSRLEMPSNPLGRRGSACRACGIVVYTNHMPKHLGLHQGDGNPDDRSVTGGYICDLCGIAFRQHRNLLKHWRCGCPEIQANILENATLLTDDELRHTVSDLLKRAVTIQIDRLAQPKQDFGEGGSISRDGGGGDDSNRIILDRGFDDNGVVDVSQRQGGWDSTDQSIVFADDFGDDVDGVLDNSASLLGQESREKWRVGIPGSAGLQCPECFRSFANVGRLERHIAGFHASFGSHHCVLCGNRFKYDYNLLYHYRRSCPYTKTFIQPEIRENVDATSLRRAVRNLAQKEVKLTPQVKPETLRLIRERHPKGNDSKIRKEMLKYPSHGGPPPPQLLTPRHGVPGAEACPVCGVFFYGKKSLDRHVHNAHGIEPSESLAQNADIQIVADERAYDRREEYLVEYLEEHEEEDVLEPPPQLERQEPVQSPRREIENTIIFLDSHGNPNMDLDEANASALSQMFETGEVNVGDRVTVRNQGLLIQFNVISFITNKKPWTVTIVKEAAIPVSLEEEAMYAEELMSSNQDNVDGHVEFGSAILEGEVAEALHEMKADKME